MIKHYVNDPPIIALTELPPRGDPVGNESTEEEGYLTLIMLGFLENGEIQYLWYGDECWYINFVG